MLPYESLTPVAATGIFSVAWLMIAIPFAMAAILLLIGKISNPWGHFVATLSPIISFGIALACFISMMGAPEAERAVTVPLWEWLTTGSWTFSLGLLIDPLSILFALLITGVGSLIHIYSIGYMSHDPRRRRFFAYLNLFIAAMLTLVLANSYVMLFMGWEGVGLASYLLISFWQHKPSAAAAGKKAFVVNRIADMGLMMAIMSMLAQFGSTSFVEVAHHAHQLTPAWATAIGIFLLVGACGKSAQFPLQSWLLDAMEGPTPVSALIHAATMVTAGVYLITRSNPIYVESETARTAVMAIGAITLLMGAWIGCAKDDIKKVLAGSTMSQIGYMILAAGIGPAGYAFAIFHLVTHGFFKANMFLGAGSLMHGMNDDVNMRHYGALAKPMRWTFLTFAMGYLAILGIPGFAGFFSKDHIIEAAFHQSPVAGVLAIVGACVTAFYMTRLMLMTFFGQKRWQEGVHPHESPLVMVIPLVVLAILSVISGWLMNGWIAGWLAPVVGAHEGHETPGFLEMIVDPLGLITLAGVLAGVVVAWFTFGGKKKIPLVAPKTNNPLIVAGRRDLFAEDINVHVFRDGGRAVISTLKGFDEVAIDGAAVGTAASIGGLSKVLRKGQTGYVRSYGLTMVAGTIALGLIMVLSRLG
ncbi:MAG: NADH-quinone oxidoreductase subunit L [Propionibacteriaceae bacterium]